MKNKIFLMLFAGMMLTMIIVLLSIQNVSAQRYGCCYRTTDEKYCAEVYDTYCESGQFLGGNCTDSRNAAKCGLVTCALEYDCMFGVKKGKCLYEHDGTVAKGDECVKECCGIAGRSYGIKTHRACINIAFRKGFNESYIEFVSTTDEHECAAHFEPTVKGCCITAEGCKDTTREECKGEFNADILCKKIPTRCQVSEVGLKCGKQPGNENKVILLDSAGGEEVKYSCSLPQYCCVECSEDVCDFDTGANLGRTTVEYAEGYCVDTSCSLKGIGKHQEVNDQGEIQKTSVKSTTLQSGQSICYNFYGVSSAGKGIAKKDQVGSIDVLYMQGRSTGLQNHKLVCNYGTIQIVGLGDDRKVLCEDDTSIYVAKKIENIKDTSICTKCGHFTPGFIDWVGDYVSVGWMLGGVFGKLISDQCNLKKCEEIKDSVTGESLCVYSYDAWQIPHLGANQAGSCVPKYPLGINTACSMCGGGSDGVWNICKEDECYALGNCQFKYNSPMKGSLYFAISLIGFYGANRLGGLPVEALAATIDTCKIDLTCYPGAYIKFLPSITSDVLTAQVKPAFEGVMGLGNIAVGFVKGVWDNISFLKNLPERFGK